VALRQAGAAPFARALPLFREIARAIDASWAAGVGHGALHPRDIFVTAGTTDVRVTGFGISQALQAVGARPPVRRPYSAPERAAGAAWDARADVYSFGVIAHETLFGYRPIGPDGESDDLPDERDASPQAQAIRRVLTAAMAEAPGDRFESAVAFVDALAGADESPRPTPRATRPRPIVLDVPATTTPEPPPADVIRPEPPRPAPRFSIDLDDIREPVVAATGAEAATFPWAAVGAVLAAGIVLGGAAGYQFGWHRASSAARSTIAAQLPGAIPVDAAPAPDVTPAPSATAPTDAPAATPAPAPAGRLVIQSVPSGALAIVDGRRVGETPVTVPVSLGAHEIQVGRPGYEPRTERVNLTSGSASRTLRYQLRRGVGNVVPGTPATGAVDVDSRPQGARVTVDGRYLGVTPLRVPELTAGAHRVKIDREGHRAVTSTVNIVGGEVTRLAVTLERSAGPAAGARRIVR
jgi:hypothetical protein